MVSHYGEIRILLHINYKCLGNFSVLIGTGPRLGVPSPRMKLTRNSRSLLCPSSPIHGTITQPPLSPLQPEDLTGVEKAGLPSGTIHISEDVQTEWQSTFSRPLFHTPLGKLWPQTSKGRLDSETSLTLWKLQ